MNLAQANPEHPLPARSALLHLLEHPPEKLLAAHHQFHKPSYRRAVEQTYRAGGRRRSPEVKQRNDQIRERVLQFLQNHAGERFTFDDICEAIGLRKAKVYRRVVFDMAADGKILTDGAKYGRAFWVKKTAR